MATRHALSDLSLLNLCPATPPGALFLLLTPSARLLTTLWRRRFMSSDKGKQKQPHPAISFSYLLLPAFFGLDRIFTFLVWPLHLLAPRLLLGLSDSWRLYPVFCFGRTVGRAAFSGNHQWIVHGTANGHGLSSEVRPVLSASPLLNSPVK